MKTVIAIFTPKPEGEAALEQGLRALVASSREEPGTLAYGISRNAKGWVVMEAYRDGAAVKAHMGSSALAALMRQVPDLVACEPEVRVMDMVEGFGFGEAR